MRDIKTQAFRSVKVTLSVQAIKFLIGLGVTMVLARLLTPKDYGLVAMAGVITGFVAVFRDGGLSIATVQRAEITDAQISTLFWINAALGTVSALVVVLLSVLVGWFYNDLSLVWILVALAVPLIIGSLSAQPQALLQRQMRFKEIAIIEIASLIISAAIGMITADAGWGSWALVTMTIVATAANSALVFFFCRWRPDRPTWNAGVLEIVKFGGELTANKFFDALAGSVDTLLMGKLFSAEMVGLYTRAQSLMLLPLSQIVPAFISVALPVLSRLAERPESLKRVFLDLLRLSTFASSFLAVFLVVGADLLIRIVLGPQWMETAEVLSLLLGPAFFIPLSTFCVVSLTAQGRGAVLWRWSLQKNIVTILAILAGITWGAHGVAGALSISSVFILLPLLNNITAKAGLANLKEVWSVTGMGLGSCVIGCGVLYLMRLQLALENPLIGLFVLFLMNVAFHAVVICALPSSRSAFARIINVISSSRTPRQEIN